VRTEQLLNFLCVTSDVIQLMHGTPPAGAAWIETSGMHVAWFHSLLNKQPNRLEARLQFSTVTFGASMVTMEGGDFQA